MSQLMVAPRKLGSDKLLEYLILLMIFFLKRFSIKSSASGNPIDFFCPLVVAPKNKSKVKKMVKMCKNDTKAGIMSVCFTNI